MNSVLEHVTHISVWGFYMAALIMGIVAHRNARLWARRVSTVAIIASAVFWLFFYTFIVEIWDMGTDVHTSVLWSRVGHYITATALFTMAYVIRRSEKFGLNPAILTDEDT